MKQYEDAVTKNEVLGYVNQGYSPKQIASIWNSGHPDWEGRKGYNKKSGEYYDTPAHVAKFELAYNGQPVKHDKNAQIRERTTQEPGRSQQSFFDMMADVFSPTSAEASEDTSESPGGMLHPQKMETGETVMVDEQGVVNLDITPIADEDVLPVGEKKTGLAGAGAKFRTGQTEQGVQGVREVKPEDVELLPGIAPQVQRPVNEGEEPQRHILPYVFRYASTYWESQRKNLAEKATALGKIKDIQTLDQLSEWLEDNPFQVFAEPIAPMGAAGKLSSLLKPKLSTPTTWQSAVNKIKSRWIGQKDYKIWRNGVEADKLQQQIKTVSGEKHFGQKSKDIDKALQLLLDTQRDPNHISRYWQYLTEEQRQVVRNAMEFQKDPEFRKLAAQIRKAYDEIGLEALDAGVIKNVLDNYAARVWKPKAEGEQALSELTRKFGTTTGHARERIFDTIIEGQAFGRELQVEGATNNLRILKDEISKVIEDKAVLKRMAKAKWGIVVDGVETKTGPMLLDHPEEGYKQVNHPNFKAYRYFGSIKVETILKHVQELSDTVSTTSTTTTTGAAGSAISGPIARLEEVVRESLKLRGMSEGEATNYIAKIKASGANGGAGTQTVIENMKERIIAIQDKAEVAGHKFEPIVRKDLVVAEDGTILRKSELYAPDEVADSLNNIMGSSALKNLPGWTGQILDSATKFNAQAKSILLMTSLFHHQAFMRSYLLGTHGILEGGAKNLSPRAAYRAGLKAIGEDHPILKELVENGGLTIGKQQEWEERVWQSEKGRIAKAIEKIPGGTAARQAFVDFAEKQTKFLFGKFGAGLKARAAILEYQYSLKQFPYWSPEFRAKAISEYVNNNFGGLNLDRLERNPTGQHMFRLGALAPDWTESNFRQFVKAFGAGEEAKLYQRFWASVAARGMAATVTANLLMSAFDDKSFFDRYKEAWSAGKLRWLDVDITPIARLLGSPPDKRKYFGIFGHMTDALNWMAHPIATLDHKASPMVVNPIIEAFTGIDWKGDPFTTWDQLAGITAKGDLKGKLTAPIKSTGPVSWAQTPSFILSQAASKLPIPFQNVFGWVTGQADGFDSLTKGLGLRTASVNEIPEWERGIRNIQSDYPHYTGATPKSKERRELKKESEKGLRIGGQSAQDAKSKLEEAVKAGKITPDQKRKIEKGAKLSELKERIKGLNVEVAVRTYMEVLTPEQRDQVRETIHGKINRSRSIGKEQKSRFRDMIKKEHD
jgi:hypothetical protein